MLRPCLFLPDVLAPQREVFHQPGQAISTENDYEKAFDSVHRNTVETSETLRYPLQSFSNLLRECHAEWFTEASFHADCYASSMPV